MKILNINTIAFQYLLMEESQENRETKDLKKEIISQNQEQYSKNKSLLSQLYNLEEEDLYI